MVVQSIPTPPPEFSPATLVARVRDALVALADDPHGRALLAAIQFTGWVAAADADWNDVRALHIDLLPIPQQPPEEPRP